MFEVLVFNGEILPVYQKRNLNKFSLIEKHVGMQIDSEFVVVSQRHNLFCQVNGIVELLINEEINRKNVKFSQGFFLNSLKKLLVTKIQTIKHTFVSF